MGRVRRPHPARRQGRRLNGRDDLRSVLQEGGAAAAAAHRRPRRHRLQEPLRQAERIQVGKVNSVVTFDGARNK